MIARILFVKATPTPAQLEAGNYRKRKLSWRGLTISIENEAGSVRRGTDRDGKTWETRMRFPYGYFNRTEGVDGDQVDVFVGPDLEAPTVYVVHQRKAGNWQRYDEDKVMIGFASEREAIAAFRAHYDDKRFLGPVTAMPAETFVEKVRATKTRPAMIKARGWWGPEHGGTHHKRTDEVVGAFTPYLPPSAGLDSLEAAQRYYRDHVAGAWTLVINRKAGQYRVRVNFNENAEHAYTKDHEKTGRREFEPGRAKLMQYILATIAGPDKVLQNGNRDLFIEKIVDGIHYAVVLEWKPRQGEYAFRSAHYWNKAEFDRNKGNYSLPPARGTKVEKGETPIRKAWTGVSDSTFTVCDPSRIGPASIHAITGETSAKPGRAPSEEGSCQPYADILVFMADLVKGGAWADASLDLLTGIELVLPSGATYRLPPAGFSFDDDATLAKALGPGERWITVHPNGKDNKGVPVLVRETQSGSGVYHVIGGAGGKLNYLKMRGLKPESSYKEQAAERRKAKAEAKKQQAKRDKELGLEQGKTKAREAVKTQRQQHERTFIQTVAQAMGWKEEEIEPKIPETLSEAAQKRLVAKHHAGLLKKANEAVELQRQKLLADAAAREEAGVITHDPDQPDLDAITTADLDDARPSAKTGLGFATKYAERAEAQGLTEDELKQEAGEKQAARRANLSEGQIEAIKKRGDAARQVKAEIEGLREPVTSNVKAVLADAQQAAALIRAQKQLKAVQQAAQAVGKDIDEAKEVKAWNLEVSSAEDLDEKVAEELENDLRTMRTRAFLSAVTKEAEGDPAVTLRQHVGAGAFNSINALALTAGGAALVDRSVVDVLGVAGAAQVLARRLHADLAPEELERLTDGMEAFHLHHYMESSKEALRQADELQEAAREIALGEASHGDDFEQARALNQKRKEAVEEAHKILGTALGEMEANAALVTALKAGRIDQALEVPLGGVSDEDAIRQARAIGLQRGDYTLDRVAGQQVLTVTPAGLDRLAKPVDREEIGRVRRNLDIIEGRFDEDDWLPSGFARRPDLALDVQPGTAPSLARKFDPSGGDLEQALQDYIGGRAADGDSPADILADIQSADFFQKAGDPEAYRAALDAVAPLKGGDGKMQRAESLTDAFNGYADAFVQRAYGGTVAPIHRQQVTIDEKAVDALHRALSDEPAGVAAYKAIGELTTDDQRTLREFFYKHVAHESPQAETLRHRLEGMEAQQPEKETVDMFGETTVNPEWQEWKSQRDTLAEEVNSASLDWAKYADAMHGHANAYAALQDMIRSRVAKSFHEAHNRLNPDAPIKLGRQVIRHNLNHLDAVDPEAREARMRKERELIDGLRERDRGRYASGAVSDKLDAAREEREAFEQSQMGFFSTEEEPGGDLFGDAPAAPKPEKPLAADERYTLGHAAERQIASLMPTVGANFKPGRPVKLFQPTMSGPDGVMRQRAIKMIEANKRVALAAGTGAGKTAMMLGAFAHLQTQGKAKRGLFLVPSIVQGEFHAEALRFLEPGRFKWHAEPGASREERIAAYKDPANHFAVMTHQSFRDDMLHLGAQQAGVTHEAMRDQLDAMAPEARTAWLKGVMEKEGIGFDFLSVDEGHNALNRQGKENSAMANVMDALSSNAEYYIHATADPIKNDLSEAHDLMRKMDPARYADPAAFMRRYGVDTQGAKAALRRELARHVLPFKIEPKVRADRREVPVKLSDAQHQAMKALEDNLSRARVARMGGQVDVEAVKAIAPAQFKEAPAEQHEAIARELSQSLGILKGAAMRQILDAHPESAKVDALAQLASERKGKPGVVFAHSLEAVENLKVRLERDGHRVITITGKDSAEDKAKKIQLFRPDKGEAQADIVVASDAGATGANLQSGQWLVQFDSPMTAMTHAQRQGRIHRIGQKNDVELLDLVADHPSERRARERLRTKYQLRELMTSPMAGLDDSGLAQFLKERAVAEGQGGLF